MPSRPRRDRAPSPLLRSVTTPPAGPAAELAILRPTLAGAIPGVDQIAMARLDALAFEHQPREIVPEEALQALIADGRAGPAATLAALEAAAGDDAYYAGILVELRGLAASIASEGVLQPIRVVLKGERLVVRDGHRRCLAALLAGAETVPAQRVEEPDELAAVAHPLIVNLQRQELTAVEKGAALLRLALAVGRRLAADAGIAPDAVTIEALVGAAPQLGDAPESSREDSTAALGAESPGESSREDSGGGAGAGRTITGLGRDLAARVRERVCAMTGLGRGPYYGYLALNRLTPAARAAGRGLTEGQLRAVVALPRPVQAEVVAFAARRRLNSKEVASLAKVAREGDRDRLRERLERLAGGPGEARVGVSWEGLLHAVPRDVDRRCRALAAELRALSPEARRKRVAAMREQRELLLALARYFERLIDEHGDGGVGAVRDAAERPPAGHGPGVPGPCPAGGQACPACPP